MIETSPRKLPLRIARDTPARSTRSAVHSGSSAIGGDTLVRSDGSRARFTRIRSALAVDLHHGACGRVGNDGSIDRTTIHGKPRLARTLIAHANFVCRASAEPADRERFDGGIDARLDAE